MFRAGSGLSEEILRIWIRPRTGVELSSMPRPVRYPRRDEGLLRTSATRRLTSYTNGVCWVRHWCGVAVRG